MKRTGFGIKAALVVGVIAALGSFSFAESIWVKSEAVEIRTGKGAVYPIVATVKKGTELNVIAHDGKWLKVSVPAPPGAAQGSPQEGYVYETAVSATKVGSGGGLFSSMSTGTDMSTAAAAKGLDESAEKYASTKNMDPGPLNRLIAMSHQINPAEWERFKAEGRVGAQ